jgi:hypothetical protein
LIQKKKKKLYKGTVPSTMSKDWQDAQQEYMKFQKMNPIFGNDNFITLEILI